MVQATADCYVWADGDYRHKYYFLKAGNIVYTFRLLSSPDKYFLAEPDFDFFVSTTVDNYLIYSPRQQFSPTSILYAASTPKEEGVSALFHEEELVSFFAPVAAIHTFSQ